MPSSAGAVCKLLEGIRADRERARSGWSRSPGEVADQVAGRPWPPRCPPPGTAPRPGRWPEPRAAAARPSRSSRSAHGRLAGQLGEQRRHRRGAGLDRRLHLRPARLSAVRLAPPSPGCAPARSRRVSAARSGRTIGRTRKLRSSRSSRGTRPARRNDDLPAPDAPSIASRRGAAASPARAAGRAPRWSAPRARRRCRRPRPPAAAARDRAAGRDRPPAARRRSGRRARPGSARSSAAPARPARR